MNSKIFLRFLFVGLVFSQGCKKGGDTTPPASGGTAPSCTPVSSPANGGQVAAGSSVTLSWNGITGATAYDVYLGTASNPTAILAANVGNTSTTFPVPATANVTYFWYVVPKNANGSASGCGSAVASFTSIEVKAPPPFGFYVVGYFPSYRNVADVPDVKFRMTNVVNYAFFSVGASGTLTVPNTAHATQVIAKAKANNTKVMLAINDGSGDGKSNFKNMASSAGGRNAFVKDVLLKVRSFGFDGVDVDWEYPTTADGSDITFTALMKELSDSLHRDGKYYLTAAITPGKYAGGARDAIKAEVFAYTDFFNIMAYDDFSSTVPFKHHSDLSLAQTALNYWIGTRGMPKEKAVLGFPAYGRPSGITQSGTILTYRDILAKGGSSQSDSAVVSNGSFANYMIYYNGQPTVKKKTMLARQQANGVMMWEKWQDAMDENSLLKAACDTIGRAY